MPPKEPERPQLSLVGTIASGEEGGMPFEIIRMTFAKTPKANPDGGPMYIDECDEKQRLSENS